VDTVERGMPSVAAALVKLLVSTTRAKMRKRSKRSIGFPGLVAISDQ
jgi:hypothetical protein